MMALKYQSQRPWDALPSTALLNIFCKTSIKDRFENIPFVCKSWAPASAHPHCWASMITESGSDSSEVAFIKDSYPYGSSFVDPFDGRRSEDPQRGMICLQALIGRAGGGAAVNSLYFFPFLSFFASVRSPPNDDELLRLIATRCPNLKNLSFHGSYLASEEAIVNVFHSCRELELIDFSDSPYCHTWILLELSCCCPKIRGIRRQIILEPNFTRGLTKWFPRLRLLNLSLSTIEDFDLLTIVTKCKELQYLDVTGCHRLNDMDIVKIASKKIAKILYD